ncbi:MAG: deoxyribodipyrimidine photo-lyase [Alphaproteobacteria bacterium]|nr:deoxyribodipyrimidine photo-lyase [Alphaproteobacteria bacterium]
MSKPPIILWFRQDLRLSDNPALHAAHAAGHPIIPLYILDDENAKEWKMGAASRVWLHHALTALNKDLSEHLVIQKGDAAKIIPDLIKKTNASGVYWNRCYEPWRIARDKKIKTDLEDQNIDVQSFNGSLLWEPWTIKNQSGQPYKVFTPYYRKGCLQASPPREPLPRPPRLNYGNNTNLSISLNDLNLLPVKERKWDETLVQHWNISENGAQKRLSDFLNDGLQNYKKGRDHPADENTSRLSPYLHFGQLSPNQAWYAAQERGTAEGWESDRDHFLSELGWREFSYSLLYHFPKMTWENLQPRFNDFPWKTKKTSDLEKWHKGLTGYPIVDAGMRQLWETGYMHNRVRMIVGSFLVKNMLTHWHLGEEWFWDCLVDADLASNAASWQWIAGCGADAAPYFRIFNPITQSQKFDEKGEYIRRFVPELKDMPDKDIHAPWEASDAVLKQAGVELGKTYPKPMMDHGSARNRALDAFKSTKTEDTA